MNMEKKHRETPQEKLVRLTQIENELWNRGARIAGIDEVGRGPLAGPVVAAAVILPEDFDVPGLGDSKKLSEKRREELFDIITERAVAYGIGMADHSIIDEINILQATKLAMKEAISSLQQQPDYILFDAMRIDDLEIPQESVIKGDAKVLAVAAASIVAKVTRDRMMAEYSAEYPGYAFEKNKGYGTKEHYEGIREHGMCPIHRRTFLKNL